MFYHRTIKNHGSVNDKESTQRRMKEKERTKGDEKIEETKNPNIFKCQ